MNYLYLVFSSSSNSSSIDSVEQIYATLSLCFPTLTLFSSLKCLNMSFEILFCVSGVTFQFQLNRTVSWV